MLNAEDIVFLLLYLTISIPHIPDENKLLYTFNWLGVETCVLGELIALDFKFAPMEHPL